jgi:phosphoglycerate dehydrogenase-like enzyme
MKEVLVLQKPHLIEHQRPEFEQCLDGLGLPFNIAGSSNEVAKYPNTEILITPALEWLPIAIEQLPNLKWIHFLSSGIDSIWNMPFDKSRLFLTKSTGVHAATVSEYVVCAVLTILKKFGRFSRQQQQRLWEPFWLEECHGKTLGILGLGAIGRHLSGLALNLGLRVEGVVATPRQIQGVDAVYGQNGLHEVLSHSDFVVALLPLTEASRRILDDDAFRSMKRSAWLINVARGEVIDQNALIDALRNEVIAGAVLDVFEEEPLPEDSPLWEMKNVLITPHVAGTTQRYISLALESFKENYISYIERGKMLTLISEKDGY